MNSTDLHWYFLSATGMMLVAIASIVHWRRKTGLAYRWFWVGAGLWAAAIVVKLTTAWLTTGFFAFLKQSVSFLGYIAIGGLFGGVQSSLCEIGLTWLAVLIWRNLGSDADRAIGIGLGAGAFEAFLLGLGLAGSLVAMFSDNVMTAGLQRELETAATATPVMWLAPIAERIIAILCHASSRAMVILGTVHRRPWMVLFGFAIFATVDGIATAAVLSTLLGEISNWWVELAMLPAALISIPVLRWCYARYAGPGRRQPLAQQILSTN